MNRKPRSHSIRPKPNAKRCDPTDIAAPEQPGHDGGETVEEGEREAGRPRTASGKRPGKAIGLDQQRLADPPETREKIAETEPPAGGEGRLQAFQPSIGGFAGGAVDQPDQDRERDEADGEEVEGRQGQNGERAGEKRQQRPPPPPEQDYPARKPLHADVRVAANQLRRFNRLRRLLQTQMSRA